MKRFSKIFAIIATMAAVVSCTTDVTEDLGVKVGGKTQLTLSLDNTRTQLGVKGEGETSYPLTWAEGDQISVNGVASEPLTATEAGSANATFTFTGQISMPFFIAYPAVEKANQVVFPAEQSYNSEAPLENGVTVMYGYSTSPNGATLTHLSGLLKIGVKGTATLTAARISTVDRKPIAGTFDATYNTESAALELTPAEAVDVINYSFGTGLELNEETASYFYVSVPAGTYNELYLVLEDANGGLMRATVASTSSKPIKAGTVREFASDLVYAATDTENVFVISDQTSLYDFRIALEEAEATLKSATASDDEKAAATATLQKEAMMVADVLIKPIKDVEHHSINAPNYKGTFNGNGYAIVFDPLYIEDGKLTEPLFDTVAATIKGVHLRGMCIAGYSRPNVGSLVNTYVGNKITNCSADGKFALNLSGAANVGGLIGYVEYYNGTVTISNCVNNCTMNVAQGNSGRTIVAGVVALMENDSNNTVLEKATFSYNSNKGAITVTGSNTGCQTDVGGVVGEIGNYTMTMSNCNNSGAVTVTLGNADATCVGGVYARHAHRTANSPHRDIHVTYQNLTNTADVKLTITGTHTKTTNDYNCVGGIWGLLYDSHEGTQTVKNCDNSGSIEFVGTTGTAQNMFAGGIAGFARGRVHVANCDNTGEKVALSLGTQGGWVGVGGLFGYLLISASDNVSNTGNRTQVVTCSNSADVSSNITSSKNMVCVGGTVGAWYGKAKYYEYMTSVTNTGDITVNNVSSTTDSNTYVGFVGTTFTGSDTDVRTNYGGLSTSKLEKCVNGVAGGDNKLTVTGSHNNLFVGGMIGYNYIHFNVTGSSNNMSYVSSATVTGNHFYGGLYGYVVPKSEFKTGGIKNDALTETKMMHTITGYTNNGDATITSPSVNTLHASGLIGQIYCKDFNIHMTLDGVTNNGDISVNGTTYNSLYVGGVLADMDNMTGSTYTLSNSLSNKGNITVTGVTANDGATTVIGGGVGTLTRDFSNLVVDCTLTVDEGVAAGMLAGVASTTEFTLTDCKVGGKFIEGTTETTLTADNLATYLFSDRVLTAYAGATLLE